MKEDLFINTIKEALPDSAKYIGDDTAYITEKDLLLTQDTLIEDIHFRMNTISPFYLGRKSIAVNLSDIAAAGGVPSYVLISLSMPKNIDENFVKEFYNGVNSICKESGALVVGGDLTAAEKITVSVCAIGSGSGLIPANRRTAKVGDVVIISGSCGSSVAGFTLLENTDLAKKIPEDIRTKFIEAHINPTPKLNEGRKILENADKPAMMDLSDGLADALYKICDLSNVSMEIEFDQIPHDKNISKIFDDETAVKKAILFGGEDYALIATVSEKIYEKLKKEISVKKIGVVKKAETDSYAYVKFKNEALKLDSEILDAGVFKHFE